MQANKLKYVIIQAGGQGKRLEHYTANKPKALMPINGMPNIFHLMSKFENTKFIIIGDYKSEMFVKYLDTFCPYDYVFLTTKDKGTMAGLNDALSYIPTKTPFMITWCDLFVTNNFLPAQIDKNKNHIGLSNKLFKCRWEYTSSGIMRERNSYARGIAGVFIFANKSTLVSSPKSGEFCAYLRDQKVSFEPIQLKNVYEFGTVSLYRKLIKRYQYSRSFNRIITNDKYVDKLPLTKFGKEIAKHEIKWYQRIARYNLPFIPDYSIHNGNLRLARVVGNSLFRTKLKKLEKINALDSVVSCINTIHSIDNPIPAVEQNDRESIIIKTKKRLDLIANVIPFIMDDYININNRKCINFYKKWNLVEHLFKVYPNRTYTPIHGDPTFSNIIIDSNKKIFLIDPRGYFGNIEFYGDPDYDWAKILYSVVGNYDQLNSKKFILSLNERDIKFNIDSNGWEHLKTHFIHLISANSLKIDFFHAIIWLSFAQYVSEDYDAMLTAFYKGLELMQEVYEKSY